MNVNFTKEAAKRVFDLITEAGEDNLSLRVSILGGGCSGFQYSFMFEENIQEDDFIKTHVVNAKDIKLVIDPISLQYLNGSTIDFKSNLQGEMFVVDNPQATTTCGCGSSFSI
jgi:iron-sulfur cluster insertion protein